MTSSELSFGDLGLPEKLVSSLKALGYEKPSPIQQETIPLLMEGHDILGQAATGTGKTAAFALPLLSRLDMSQPGPLLLVLAPTRELALQVTASLERYGSFLGKLKTVTVYGGAPISPQIAKLRQGVHVVVGTPGRIMDLMRRGNLKLGNVQGLVLDEADEMLQMGFSEDVDWILEHTPAERQTALFSATMPAPIRKLAQKHLRSPKEITIKAKTQTISTSYQCVG